MNKNAHLCWVWLCWCDSRSDRGVVSFWMNDSEIHCDDVDDTLCHFADNYVVVNGYGHNTTS
jgi:hypothetical protein